MKIALLGFGTVGSGVYNILKKMQQNYREYFQKKLKLRQRWLEIQN